MKNASEEKIEMTAGEKAFIERFVSDYCRPHETVLAERLAAFVKARQAALFADFGAPVALAAGVSAPEPVPAVKAPDEEVTFTFASDGAADDPAAWRARVTVPPAATGETMLAVDVVSSSGSPVDGVFTVAGCALPLARGHAELPFGLFLAGIKNTAVSLRGNDGVARAGRLTFF